MSWQLIPVHFAGPTEFGLGILAFRPSDGAFAKWYRGGNENNFTNFIEGARYQDVRYIGGKAGTWTDAQLIPIDFNGDGNVDILAFRPSDGAFAKWYSDGTIGPDFIYQDVRYIGGKAGTWTGARLIPADFNGDGREDILAFLPDADTSIIANSSISLVAKWYSDVTIGPDFVYEKVLRIGVKPRGTPSLDLIPVPIPRMTYTGWSSAKETPFLVFFPQVDAFTEWYGDQPSGTDLYGNPIFEYNAYFPEDYPPNVRFIGGGVTSEG